MQKYQDRWHVTCSKHWIGNLFVMIFLQATGVTHNKALGKKYHSRKDCQDQDVFRLLEQHGWVIIFLAWPCTCIYTIGACLCVTILVSPCRVYSLMADQLTNALMELAWGMSWAGGTSALEGSHRFHFLPLKARLQSWRKQSIGHLASKLKSYKFVSAPMLLSLSQLSLLLNTVDTLAQCSYFWHSRSIIVSPTLLQLGFESCFNFHRAPLLLYKTAAMYLAYLLNYLTQPVCKESYAAWAFLHRQCSYVNKTFLVTVSSSLRSHLLSICRQ